MYVFRASEMLDEAFEMVANTVSLGPSSPQAASIFMAHVSVLQRVGLFEKLIQVLSCLPLLFGPF
jgi:hypothetical protein